MLDLSKFDTSKKANQGQFMQLLHPGTGAKLFDPETKEPAGLFLMGRDSDAFIKHNHEKNNSRLKGDVQEQTSESIRQGNIELLASLTTGWQHLGYLGDSDFSRDTIIQLYSDPGYSWIYEQANLWADNRANFI